MSKRTRLLGRLKHVYSHNTKLVLDVENKDIELIIEGLEKQIAKKLIDRKATYDLYGEYDGDICTCPRCKNKIYDDGDTFYCRFCGQKLEGVRLE